GVLWRHRTLVSPRGLCRTSGTAQAEEMVRLQQAALRRAGSGARLSRPLHPSRRHLEQSPPCSRWARRDLPLQGLPPQRAGAVLHNDARRRRVHQALSAPRSAKEVSSHPPLRTAPSAGCKTNIALAKALMATPSPEADPPAVPDPADPDATTDHRPPCPCCGGRMIIVQVFARGAAPRGPPSGAGIQT